MTNCFDKAMELVQLTLKMEELINKRQKLNDVGEEILLDEKIGIVDIQIHEIKKGLLNSEYKAR